MANASRLGKTADYRVLTDKARKGLRAKFEREALEANPNLSPKELASRADELHRAHMFRMTLKATQSRRRAREATAAAEAAEAELRALGD